MKINQINLNRPVFEPRRVPSERNVDRRPDELPQISYPQPGIQSYQYTPRVSKADKANSIEGVSGKPYEPETRVAEQFMLWQMMAGTTSRDQKSIRFDGPKAHVTAEMNESLQRAQTSGFKIVFNDPTVFLTYLVQGKQFSKSDRQEMLSKLGGFKPDSAEDLDSISKASEVVVAACKLVFNLA